MVCLGSLRIGLEGALLVAKKNGDGATLNEHIRVMGVIGIKKAQRDGGQIGSGAREMVTKEEASMSRIVARQLNDLDLTVIIDGEKMGRLASLFLPDECVSLKGAWSAILPIIEGELCPAYEGLPRENEQEHEAHAQSDNGGQGARGVS